MAKHALMSMHKERFDCVVDTVTRQHAKGAVCVKLERGHVITECGFSPNYAVRVG